MSKVEKSFQTLGLADGILDGVVTCLIDAEKKAKSSREIQTLDVNRRGLRQDLYVGKLMVIPHQVMDDTSKIPDPLLKGAVLRLFDGEEAARLEAHRLSTNEFDDLSDKDITDYKDKVFRDDTNKLGCVVIFQPAWANFRDYHAFRFTKDVDKLKLLVRHLVFSAYYNPSLSALFDTLTEEAVKLDAENITHEHLGPAFEFKGEEQSYPILDKGDEEKPTKAKKGGLKKRAEQPIESAVMKLSPDAFVQGYLEAAVWTGTDDEGNTLDNDGKFSSDDFSPDALRKAEADCTAFVQMAGDLLQPLEDSRAGHLFWLNRNGHGTGFWDEDSLDEASQKKLDELAHSFGECDLYVSDDGELEFSGGHIPAPPPAEGSGHVLPVTGKLRFAAYNLDKIAAANKETPEETAVLAELQSQLQQKVGTDSNFHKGANAGDAGSVRIPTSEKSGFRAQEDQDVAPTTEKVGAGQKWVKHVNRKAIKVAIKSACPSARFGEGADAFGNKVGPDYLDVFVTLQEVPALEKVCAKFDTHASSIGVLTIEKGTTMRRIPMGKWVPKTGKAEPGLVADDYTPGPQRIASPAMDGGLTGDDFATGLNRIPDTGQGTVKDNLAPRNEFKVTFEDGNTLNTGFNGTLEEANAYYVGHRFNFGDTDEHPADKMVRAVAVEQLNKVASSYDTGNEWEIAHHLLHGDPRFEELADEAGSVEAMKEAVKREWPESKLVPACAANGVPISYAKFLDAVEKVLQVYGFYGLTHPDEEPDTEFVSKASVTAAVTEGYSGLRSQPDYGEAGSYTAETNEQNASTTKTRLMLSALLEKVASNEDIHNGYTEMRQVIKSDFDGDTRSKETDHKKTASPKTLAPAAQPKKGLGQTLASDKPKWEQLGYATEEAWKSDADQTDDILRELEEEDKLKNKKSADQAISTTANRLVEQHCGEYLTKDSLKQLLRHATDNIQAVFNFMIQQGLLVPYGDDQFKIQTRTHTEDSKTGLWNEDDDDENELCPNCLGPGTELGTLGSRRHFRCRDCGMDYSRKMDNHVTAEVNQETKNYREGFRAGHLDASMGIDALVTSQNNPNLPGYSTGYYDGYHGLKPQVPILASARPKQALTYMHPGQVLEQFYPDVLKDVSNYPQGYAERNYTPPPLPLELRDNPDNAQVTTKDYDDQGMKHDKAEPGLIPSQDVNSVPLKPNERSIRGPFFSDQFYRIHTDISPALLTMKSSLENKTAAAPEKSAIIGEFLRKLAGEIASSLLAAFVMTDRPLFTGTPAYSSISLLNEGDYLPMNPILTTGGLRPYAAQLKALLNAVNDGELADAINDAWAQGGVWHGDEGSPDRWLYEIFVRIESVDVESLQIRYKYITGIKE